MSAHVSGAAQEAPTAIQPELTTRLLEVARAIDDVLVANHTLRASLKPGHPPFDAAIAAGLARYGPGPLFALWLECRAVEALRVAWTGRSGPAVAAAADEPDEASGLAVEAPAPADDGTDKQQRLDRVTGKT